MIFGNSPFSSVCAHSAVGKHNFWRNSIGLAAAGWWSAVVYKKGETIGL